jgi:hypothetical protein
MARITGVRSNHLNGGDINKSVIVFYSMDNRPRIDLMKALAAQQWKDNPDILQEFQELMHKITDASNERNSVFHCTWGTSAKDKSSVSKHSIRTRGGSHSFKTSKETVNTLAAKAKKVALASQSVMDFIDHAELVPALPDILKKQLGPYPENKGHPHSH